MYEISSSLTCLRVQLKPSVLIARDDGISDRLTASAISCLGRNTNYLCPHRQGFWDFSHVLRAQEHRLVITQINYMHSDSGNRVEVIRKTSVRGFHCEFIGGFRLISQRVLQAQNSRNLIQREEATVCSFQGIPHL